MQSPGAAAGLAADRPVRVRTSPPPECAAVSKWYLYGIALVAGVANAIEPGQNATLAKVTGQPMLAGLFCFGLAIACFLAAMVVARVAMVVTLGRRDSSTREQLLARGAGSTRRLRRPPPPE